MSKSNAINDNMSKSIEVLSNKRELENRTLMSYGVGAIGAIVAFMALYTTTRSYVTFAVIGIPIAIFFLVCLYGIYAAFHKISKKDPYFVIDEKGFYFKGIFNTATTIKWDNIENFEYDYYKGEKTLVVYIKDESFVAQECSFIGKMNYNSMKKALKAKAFWFPESYFDEDFEKSVKVIEYYTKTKIYRKQR